MSPRSIVLGAVAALVAAGGVYLMIEVRASGAAAPSDKALKEAADRHARVAGSAVRPPRIEDLGAGATGATGGSLAPKNPDLDRRVADAFTRDKVALDQGSAAPDPALNPDFDTAMLEANKLYDRHNYEDARQLALKLLDREPGTVRMLRVVVSSSCILGDAETAQKYWPQLPEFDRGQMTSRCERFGVNFTP